MTTCTKSFVHNGSMDYHAWAHDFKLPDGTPGCATCSSGGDLGEGLHAVRAERYLRSRLDSHGVSSFGRLSALKGYDVSLKWPEEHLESIMSLHEAGQINSVAQLNWQASRMTWAPINSGTPAFGLTLYDTSGSPLTTFADRELAHTGVFLKADGDSIHFEIIRKGTQVYGRPVAFADRNGNLTTVEYVDAQPTFGTAADIDDEGFVATRIHKAVTVIECAVAVGHFPFPVENHACESRNGGDDDAVIVWGGVGGNEDRFAAFPRLTCCLEHF